MKNMKNKKGFTLIEIIASVLILGLILIIAIPTVNKYIIKGKNSYYISLEKEIKTSGMDYLETYRTLLPRKVGHVKVISISELTENNYLEPVKDENGDLCEGQVTVMKVKNDSYKYYSCIKCGDYYESKISNCSYRETDNIYEDTADYRVVINNVEVDTSKGFRKYTENEKTVYEVPQGEQFDLPTAIVYHKSGDEPETVVDNALEGIPNQIDINELSSGQEIIYYYHGAKDSIIVKVVDRVAPTKPQVVLKYDNENGKSYNLKWTNRDIYAEYMSTDYTIKGVMGSGIDHYEISMNNGETFGRIDDNNYIHLAADKNGEKTFLIRSVDKAGNVSEANSYTIKIDNQAPSCELVFNGTKGRGNWYISDVSITYDNLDGTGSNIIVTAPIADVTESVNGKQIVGVVTDEAGNTATCPKKILYVDKETPTAPTIVATDGIESNLWHLADVVLNLSSQESVSGNLYFYNEGSLVIANTNYSTDGYTTNGSGNNQIVYNQETNGKEIYAIACSRAGLCSGNSSYTIKLDKTDPTCTITGDSVEWTKENRTITYGCSDTENGSGCDPNYTGGSILFDSTTKTATLNSYVIKDLAGREVACEARTANVYVDKTAPTKPDITNPKNDTWTNDNIILGLNGNDKVGTTYEQSGVDKYQYSYNQTTWYDYDSNTPTITDEQNRTIYVRICDNVGNCGTTDTTIVKIDKTKPEITNISNPTNGNWTNEDFSLTITAKDTGAANNANSGISYYRYKYENDTVWTTYSNSAKSPFTTTPFSVERNEKVIISVCDKAGNCSSEDNSGNSTDIKIDKTNPTCSINVKSGTLGDNNWYTSNVELEFSAMDGTGSNIKSSNISPNPLSTNGISTVVGTVKDEAGNTGTCSLDVKVDKEAPTCTFSGESTTWTKESRTITATCNDNTNGSGCYTSLATKNWSFNSGTHEKENLSYTIKDNAGNESECSKNANVYVDKDAPSKVTITNPTNGNWTNQKFSLTLASSDTGSGIDYYQYKYASTNWKTYENSSLDVFETTRFAADRNEKVYLRACDKVGNCTDPSDTFIKIDRTAPELQANGPVNHIVTITATDSGSQVSKMEYEVYLNNVLKSSNDNLVNNSFIVDLNKNGTWLIKVKAYDNATNVSNNGNWTEYTYENDLCIPGQMTETILRTYYGECDATCGGGKSYKFKDAELRSTYGNEFCQTVTGEQTNEYVECNTQPCCTEPTTKEWSFSYNNSVQSFTVPYDGVYNLEVWGAQGGNEVDAAGGKGSYASGHIKLNQGDKLYIVTGGTGSNTTFTGTYEQFTPTVATGGYNGGADGYADWHKDHCSYRFHYFLAASGGGASHIALNSNRGELKNYESYTSEILIVAGGGGGAMYDDEPQEYTCCADTPLCKHGDIKYNLVGGSGNGGGTLFGQGNVGAGGGGYTGGISATSSTASGGGTSYVGNVSDTTVQDSVQSGNGKAKITLTTDVCETSIYKPLLTTSDNVASNNWHNAAYTITIGEQQDVTYYYSIGTPATTSSTQVPSRTISVPVTNNNKTYYVMVCNSKGKCSDQATYVSKIDTVAPTCTNSGDSTEWTNSNRTILFGCNDELSGCNPSYNGGSVLFDTTTKTSSIAAYTIKDLAGNTKSCPARTANVYIDKVAPSKPTITNPTNGNWTNDNFSLVLSSSDNVGTSFVQSNINKYQYSYDTGTNKTWTDYTDSASTSFTTTAFSKERNQLVYVRACDNVGNCSDVESTYIRIDKTAPTCADKLQGTSSTWTTEERTVTAACTDNASGSGCDSLDANTQFSKKFTTTTKTANISFDIKDTAGNTTTCTYNDQNIYVDKTNPSKPVITNSSNGEWSSSNVRLSFAANDKVGTTYEQSGIAKYQYSFDTGTNKTWHDYENDYKIYSTNQNRQVFVRACDNLNQCGEYDTTWIKIDKEISCNLKVKSGTLGENGWYTSDVEVEFDGLSSNIETSNIDKTTFTSSGTATGTVTNRAGLSTTCTLDIKIDKDAPTCKSPQGTSTSWQYADRTITYGCTDVGTSGCNPSYSGGSKTFSTTTKVGTINAYTIKDNAGNTTTCSSQEIDVYVDKTAPAVPTLTNSSGGNWTGSNVTIGYTSNDKVDTTYEQSGVTKYQYSFDTGTNKVWSNLTGTSKEFTENQEKQIFIRACDSVNNCSNPASTWIKIDKNVSSCSLRVKSGTIGENGWYTSNVVVEFAPLADNIVTSNIDKTSFTSSGTATGTVTNRSGDTATCTLEVNIDKDAPTCTLTPEPTASWSKSNRTFTYGCSDVGTSGCNPSYSGGSKIFSTTTKVGTINSYTIKDNAGNTTTCSSQEIDVYVDKTAPAVPTLTNASGGYWTKSNIGLKMESNDSDGTTYEQSGVAKYQYSFDTGSSKTWSNYASSSGNSFTNIYSTNQNRQIFVRACDGVNNCSDYVSTWLKIDKTAPVLQANGPTNHIVTISASDSESQVSKMQYEIYLNNVLQSSNNNLEDTEFTVALNKNGTWLIKVKAYDNATNVSNNGNWKEYTYENNLCVAGQTTKIVLRTYYGECTAACGGGRSYKYEDYELRSSYGNELCQTVTGHQTEEYEECNTQACCTEPTTKEWTFSYKGKVQSFTVPYDGVYNLEVWGAQGGNYDSSSGGLGGYSSGNVALTQGTTLYIVVGGKGGDKVDDRTSGPGGYNGGGKGAIQDRGSDISYYYRYHGGVSGGGATHIGTFNQTLVEHGNTSGLYIVAGGGGGAGKYFITYAGGTGGGTTGGSSPESASQGALTTGGTQTSGGTCGGNNNEIYGIQSIGTFGQGAEYTSGSEWHGAGGGGGLYGGGFGVNHQTISSGGGGGGSGYIGGVSNGSMENGIRSGNGQAKITLTTDVCETSVYKPLLTTSDNVASNNWHNAAYTITIGEQPDVTYYYSIGTPATTSSTQVPSRTISVPVTNHNKTYYVMVCNSKGKCSDQATYVSKIDTVAPTCTNSGDSTTWTDSDRTITFGCNDTLSGCNPSYSGGSREFTTTTQTATIAAYTIRDNAGNVKNCSSRTANVYVDKDRPTVPTIGAWKASSGTALSSGQWSNEWISYRITGSSAPSGIARLEYCVDNNNTCTPNLTFTTDQHIEGTKYIRYRAVSNTGATSDIGSFLGNIDLDKPTISFSLNEGYYNTTKSLKVTVNDDHFGKMSVHVYKNTTTSENLIVSKSVTDLTTSNQFTVALDSEDKYLIYAMGYDLAGNRQERDDNQHGWYLQTYVIDLTDPTVTYNPTGFGSNTNQTVVVTPHDTNYDYMNVHVYNWTTGNSLIENKSTTNSHDSSFSVTLDSEGYWDIYTQVYDKSGRKQHQEPDNGYGWYKQTYTIDKTGPVITASGPNNHVVTVSATDALSTVSRMEYSAYLGSTLIEQGAVVDSKNTTLTSSGTWTLNYKAFDSYGNTTEKSFTYTVNYCSEGTNVNVLNSYYGSCSASCGGGRRYKYIDAELRSTYGNELCQTITGQQTEEYLTCNTQECCNPSATLTLYDMSTNQTLPYGLRLYDGKYSTYNSCQWRNNNNECQGGYDDHWGRPSSTPGINCSSGNQCDTTSCTSSNYCTLLNTGQVAAGQSAFIPEWGAQFSVDTDKYSKVRITMQQRQKWSYVGTGGISGPFNYVWVNIGGWKGVLSGYHHTTSDLGMGVNDWYFGPMAIYDGAINNDMTTNTVVGVYDFSSIKNSGIQTMSFTSEFQTFETTLDLVIKKIELIPYCDEQSNIQDDVLDNQQTGCTLTSGTSAWSYTNVGLHEFVVPVTGNYKVEAWGAAGGSWTEGNTVHAGGKGGYSAGTVRLQKGEKLYLGVGGQGGSVTSGSQTGGAAGFNGGGAGGNDTSGGSYGYNPGAGGGGASHVALNVNRGELVYYEKYIDELLIVAGGGGGGAAYFSSYSLPHGGGLSGVDGTCVGGDYSYAPGATLTSGYKFGLGKDGSSSEDKNYDYMYKYYGFSGSGGGLYGGGAPGEGNGVWCIGAGGSSFYGGVTDPVTHTGTRNGNGAVVITLLSQDCGAPEVTLTTPTTVSPALNSFLLDNCLGDGIDQDYMEAFDLTEYKTVTMKVKLKSMSYGACFYGGCYGNDSGKIGFAISNTDGSSEQRWNFINMMTINGNNGGTCYQSDNFAAGSGNCQNYSGFYSSWQPNVEKTLTYNISGITGVKRTYFYCDSGSYIQPGFTAEIRDIVFSK